MKSDSGSGPKGRDVEQARGEAPQSGPEGNRPNPIGQPIPEEELIEDIVRELFTGFPLSSDLIEDLRADGDLERVAKGIVSNTPIRSLLTANTNLRSALTRQNDEIGQTLGKALGYPWFKDDQKNFPDATEENGVCVGDHVAESLATEASREIANLQQQVKMLEEALDHLAASIEAENERGIGVSGTLMSDMREARAALEARTTAKDQPK